MKATHAEVKRLALMDSLSRLAQLESYKNYPGIYERLIIKAREVITEAETARASANASIKEQVTKKQLFRFTQLQEKTIKIADTIIEKMNETINDLILFEAWQRLPAGSVETYFII